MEKNKLKIVVLDRNAIGPFKLKKNFQNTGNTLN